MSKFGFGSDSLAYRAYEVKIVSQIAANRKLAEN